MYSNLHNQYQIHANWQLRGGFDLLEQGRASRFDELEEIAMTLLFGPVRRVTNPVCRALSMRRAGTNSHTGSRPNASRSPDASRQSPNSSRLETQHSLPSKLPVSLLTTSSLLTVVSWYSNEVLNLKISYMPRILIFLIKKPTLQCFKL